jgi:hypothetical protein
LSWLLLALAFLKKYHQKEYTYLDKGGKVSVIIVLKDFCGEASSMSIKNGFINQVSVILATQEAEIRRILV